MIQQLGNFRLIKKLGEGGMGAVYLAEDVVAQRNVALKILPDQMSRDSEFLSRFRREAKATGRLNHINIVSAFTVGEDKGYHYFAMEYCPGASLDALIKTNGFLGWAQATDLVLQVAQGLKHAHAQGFIHRDIKPHNVILGEDGVAKILDMGLSKNISGDAQSFATQSGSVLGTPHYIAPEQARAEESVDGRVDIYSLGATYFHLLTGKTVYSGSSAMAIVAKHMTEPLPDIQKIQDGIPDNVAFVIKRMLAKNPGDRYRDCGALIEDLERIKAGETPSALETALANTVTLDDRRGGGDRRERGNRRTAGEDASREGPGRRGQRRGEAEARPAKKAGPPLYFAIGGGALLVLLAAYFALRGNSNVATPGAGSGSGTASTTKAPAPPPSQSPPVERPTPAVPPPPNPPQPDAAGNWLHLLRTIDPSKDSRHGSWSLADGALHVAPGPFSALQTPYRPADEYDLRATFTVQSGTPDVNLLIVKDGRFFHWMAGGNHNSVLGFAKFNGEWTRHPSSVMRPSCLQIQRQYTTLVEVRRDSIKGYLDGKLEVTLDRDLDRFSPASETNVDTNAGVGVLAHECEVVFQSIEVRDVGGKGRFTRTINSEAAK